MMGRKRQKDRHLPERVYRHGKKYRYHHRDGSKVSFENLTEAVLYAANLHEGGSIRTIRQLLAKYETEVLPTNSSEWAKTQRRWVSRIRKHLGHIPVNELTTQHGYQLLEHYKSTPTQANHMITLLSHALKKGIRWGAVNHNPLTGIEKFRLKPSRRYITDEDFWAVHAEASPMVQIAMELAYLTGLRRGDILALTRDNLTDDGILVTPSKTKDSSGVDLLIEWSDDLRDVVARAKAMPPQVRPTIVCNSLGKPYTGSGFNAAWQRLKRRTEKKGINYFQFKDIRAKNASDDASLESASDRLGHTEKGMTQRVYIRTPRKVRPLK